MQISGGVLNAIRKSKRSRAAFTVLDTHNKLDFYSQNKSLGSFRSSGRNGVLLTIFCTNKVVRNVGTLCSLQATSTLARSPLRFLSTAGGGKCRVESMELDNKYRSYVYWGLFESKVGRRTAEPAFVIELGYVGLAVKMACWRSWCRTVEAPEVA
jgi:hypothetical protein